MIETSKNQQKSNDKTSVWLWFAYKGDPVPLDSKRYESIRRIDGEFSLPDWVCRMPNDGLHLRMDFRKLDVHVARSPTNREDISCLEYSINVIRMDWFTLFSKAINSDQYLLGDILLNDRVLPAWKTIVTRHAPRLRRQKETTRPACPVCGFDDMSYHLSGKFWLDERDESHDQIMATTFGIFVRQDIIEECKVPIPRGAFRHPSKLRFRRPT